MISFGGMLSIVMVQQPSKLLFTYQSPQKNILSISYGQILFPHPSQNIVVENISIDPFSVENTISHPSKLLSLLLFLLSFLILLIIIHSLISFYIKF